MNELAHFIAHHGGLVTVLSVCFASPQSHDNYGCKALWQKAGSHIEECRIIARDPASFTLPNKGDRLRCDVTEMEVTLAQRLAAGEQ